MTIVDSKMNLSMASAADSDDHGRAVLAESSGCGRTVGGPDMTSTDLEGIYRAYLRALNERRFDDLRHYVHDELTYNGDSKTRRQYSDMIAADVAAIPDLVFDANIIVAGADRVACRLTFDCTPRHDFLGFSPSGARLSFAEHVFYEFRAGRITSVSSLIDRYAIQQQLSRDTSS